MLKKTLIAAALAAISGSALAHPQEWAPAHGYRAHHERDHRVPARYYYIPPRPATVVPYYAPPVAYRPAIRVVAPIAPGVSIRLDLPL